MSFTRTAAFSGIIFVVLIVISVAMLGLAPMLDEEAGGIGNDILDVRRHESALTFGMTAIPFFAVFLGGLLRPIRASDQEHGDAWGVVVLTGAILVVATTMIGSVLSAVLVFDSGDGLDPPTARALWDGQLMSFALTGTAMTTLTAGVAIPGLKYNLQARWLSWLGLLAAVLGVLSLISLVNASDGASLFGWAGLIGFLGWALATSIMMLRED